MPEIDNLGEFFKENKNLVREYLETQLEIYKLRFIRSLAKTVGSFIWIMISLFLLSLLVLFAGLVTGFWLSELLDSYTQGFGITTLIMLVIILLVAALRKSLFVNPIIKLFIRKMHTESDERVI